MWYSFRPYVSVAQRQAQAKRELQKRQKAGEKVTPIVIEGRTTFWGKAWCKNLESYSDYSNRLPRGRSYVCNGSVVDLQIQPGKITALVSGSSLYRITIAISTLTDTTWRDLKTRCAGQIGSLVELLKGGLAKSVIEIVTAKEGGLFPKPKEIKMSCSCPDSAGMCKHLAATMYGVGSRLDHQPELLFLLRKVDHLELIAEAASNVGKQPTTQKKTLAASELANVFGIDIAGSDEPAEAPAIKKRTVKSKTAVAVKTRARTKTTVKTSAKSTRPKKG
jgi:uncharacterized Zn finger protein